MGLSVAVNRPRDRLAAAEFAGNRSIFKDAVVTRQGLAVPKRCSEERAWVVMKVRPMGMLLMMQAGWINWHQRDVIAYLNSVT